ncbi:SPARC [Euwallacea fornicatus]|uniref:SPARC n=1 Tax=Euwallacea fornicatus TaxID=995702 RepID=UPI00338DAF88
MKFLVVVTLLVLAALFTDVLASDGKPRKHKKYRRPRPTENSAEINDEQKPKDSLPPMAAGVDIIDNRVPITDPCLEVRCAAGLVCELDKEGEPQCVCIETCPEEVESRRKVCSNMNETWPSDCSVYQQRCWCRGGDARCQGEKYQHLHIEYYGTCREMPECTDNEMADFPRRMRDWLFNVMRDLADRRELTPHYLKMEKEAESNMTRRWTNAALWKFCDLDGHPPDRYISRHELFPIRAPLMALEHCIAPFLNSCDSDDDHRITIKEWAKCLELEEDDIEDKCDLLASQESSE